MQTPWTETQATPLSGAPPKKRPGAAPVTVAQAAFLMLHLLTWLAATAQFFIDQDYDNLIGTAMVVSSASVTFLYILRTHALREVPLSTMAVLGLCVTTQWGALIGQSVVGNSLTANLRVPLQTFGYLLGFQLTAISAHWISRRFTVFMSARRALSEGVVARLGVFRIPRVEALWAMGVFGLLTILGSRLGEGNLLSKIADGFSLTSFAPFIIPLLYLRHGSAYCAIRRHLPFLLLFIGLFVVLGLAYNARSTMLVGAVTGTMLLLLFLLDHDGPLQWRHVRNALVAVAVGAALYQPVVYVALGMQAARAERSKLSPLEMINHTLQVLRDPTAIQRELDDMVIASEVRLYDENYFKSSILGRLIEIKFHDNGFFMVEGISPAESRLVAEDARDRILSILPYPVLRAMDIGRAKFVSFYSAGDVLANMRLGVELGSFRTGSLFAQGIAIFGVWAPFAYFLFCILIFIIWDMLSRPGSRGVPAVVSIVGLLLFYRVFAYGIVSESISGQLGLLLRFQLQNVLFYALIFAVTRLIWKPFDPVLASAGVTRDAQAVGHASGTSRTGA